MEEPELKMEDRSKTDDIQLKLVNGRMRLDAGASAHGNGHAHHDHTHHDHAHQHPAPQNAPNFIPLTAVRPAAQKLDLEAVRTKLAGAHGKEYWRSLEELADTQEFQEFLQREFPRQAPRDMEPLSRRDFLRLTGAALALAGVSGCAYQPAEKIIPYVTQPEELVPGKPLFYATAMPMSGYANGVLAESHMGRPIKLEGNPDHPQTVGRSDIFTQASILDLYDPDRSQTVLNRGRIATWENFMGAMVGAMGNQRTTRGAGLRILTETITSPTLTSQIRALLAAFPGARWHQYEPVNRDNVIAGARLAFGSDVQTVYHFDRAKRIVSLDADFLIEEPARVRYGRDFINGRRVRKGTSDMNRLYVVESTHTITGAMADHRLPLQSSQVEGFARALAAAVGVAGVTGGTTGGDNQKWITELATDLKANRGASLVVAGLGQPAFVHALAHAINQTLGNVGKTVTYTAPVEANPLDQNASLTNLANDIRAGSVTMLVMLGGNTIFTAPADLKLSELLDPQKNPKRPLTIHVGQYDDETAEWSDWHIPETHYLEAWSDVRAFNGTVSLIQPLVRPLYDAVRSPHEVLAVLLGQGSRSSYDIVMSYWQAQRPGADFDKFWQKALHDGIIPNTAAAARTVALKPGFATAAAPAAKAGGMEIVFRPDPNIWDGRFANNAWLQELPKPITKLTWDNAALISPKTAQDKNLSNEDLVDLSYQGRTLRLPVWIMPGHADNSITVHLGYGRTRTGKVGTGTGFNAYALRTSTAPWFGTGVEIKSTGGRYQLAKTQGHFNVEGRDLVRVETMENFTHGHYGGPEGQHEAKEDAKHQAEHNLYPREWPSDTAGRGEGEGARGPTMHAGSDYNQERYGQYQWGMAIDLNACIGCNACVIGCNAENNVPTVGKDMVAMNREMHWIRIDTYFKGDLENPETVFEPMLCQHCEKAPCEPVCPVEATSHSAEGINEMTYNRCIGTRYCSNNCPYKVRRYNFLQFADQQTPTIKLMYNPDVTVRSRGVMEKCTYCIQRVNNARIEAEKEDRPIREGEVVTACQQSCPTDAIVFGNIADPKSAVSKLKAQPHNFGILTELNTAPRTSYLARLRNPNPALSKPGQTHDVQGESGHGEPGPKSRESGHGESGAKEH